MHLYLIFSLKRSFHLRKQQDERLDFSKNNMKKTPI